jgi:hypothetical protein
MSRRAVGVAVLFVALLCSVVVAKAGGLRMAGTAMLPPGLGTPTLDDCLTSISGPLATGIPPSPVSIDSAGATAVTFADCAGDHRGEVAAIRRMQVQPTGTADSADSDGEWCQQVAVGYRSYWLYRLRDASIGLWVPVTGERFVAILSAPSADSADPRWAACAVLPPGLEPYRGSYIGSLTHDRTPGPFGLCRSGDENDRWVSCVTPHRTQVFGTAGGQPLSARQGSSACRALIAGMTGMPDISAGGVLRVVVVGGGSGPTSGAAQGGAVDGPGNTGTSVSDSFHHARCELTVVGDGRLNGTLIGIGRGPLPLA